MLRNRCSTSGDGYLISATNSICSWSTFDNPGGIDNSSSKLILIEAKIRTLIKVDNHFVPQLTATPLSTGTLYGLPFYVSGPLLLVLCRVNHCIIQPYTLSFSHSL